MGDSDSDDSESEGGLGNVSRVVMRPPGHSGKAKKGHLCFDAAFETGNLGRVDLVNEYEYDLFIRPDTCNPRFRIWFHFTVDNIRLDQRVIFNIVNMSKKKNHLLDGMTPIVRSTTRPKWQRLPNQVVYYYRSPEHRNQYVLSFTFAFDREEEVYHFALCRPYSYSRCQAHLEQLDRRGFPHVRREVLAESLQHRRLDVLTITAPSNMDAPLNQRVVVILARVHPGEAPSSFICQGLIDFLAGSHPIAVLLRDHVIFKIVPMMNPDGVFLGNQKCSLLGLDLNRGWIDATPLSHPTLDAVQNLLADLNQRKDVHLDFVFDIHAHTSLHGAFIYGNSYDDVYRYERHIVYPKLLAQNAEDFNSLDTMYNRDPKKAGTARRYLCATLKDSVNCYTLFASLHGYRRDTPPYFLNYSEEGYYRLGRNVARTYLDYYHVVGVIPVGLPASPGALKRARRSRPRHRRRSRSWPSREPRRRTPGGRVEQLRPHQVQCYCVITSSSEDEDEDAETYFLAGRPFPPPRPMRSSHSPPRGPHHPHRSPPRTGRYAPRHASPPGAPRARRKVGGGGVISSSWFASSAAAAAAPVERAERGPHPTPGGDSPPPLLSIIDFNQLARGGLEAAAGGGGGGGGAVGPEGGAASSCPRIRVRTARERSRRRLISESSAAG